jgi:uncharacterized protein YecE (DUF72 family)
MHASIRVGVGGWVFPPWRETFYPKSVKRGQELAYASRAFRVTEINVTYHAAQTPETFARWAAETPDDFRFTVKASRACTNRRVLAEAGEAIDRFMAQGLDQLGDRLGPILWQFMPTKKFDPADFAAFLELLPTTLGDRPVRHAVEVRHASFADPRFHDLCRARGVAICLTDKADVPLIDEPTAGFAYVHLMRGEDDIPTGYPPDEIPAWARRLRALSQPGEGADPREVFAFFIHGGKSRAPAAALALTDSLGALS